MPAKKDNLTLRKLMNAADRGYPDGIVGMYHQDPDHDHGDSLARFVAIELRETFDEDASRSDQVQEAIRVLENARRELEGVINEIAGLAR